jgi:CheY-like chemotaxis protein
MLQDEIMANILAVDDEQLILTVLKVLLKKDGHTVTTATDGSKALEEIERSMPDLVISDIRMLPMNGLELLKEIRKKWHDLPVIMVTAFASAEAKEQATQLGVGAYLNKPFGNDELVNAVNRTLDKYASV